jgi:lipoprotein-anchoring transpeptidase ErfK/SrfK
MLGAMVAIIIGATGVDPSQFTGKTVVVDVSSQRIVCIEKGRIVYFEKVSTGANNSTLTGTFTVNDKWPRIRTTKYKPNITLHWVVRIKGDYLFHLRPKPEHERLLGKPVSHGCVRLSKKFAPKFYTWATKGTKIIIQR